MVNTIAGVDYGAKIAGTTCLCYNKGQEIYYVQSTKNRDADVFLYEHLLRLQPALTGIDAPLSLPAIYTGTGEDYFYRQADKEVQAMSPMFLGGLTARAIKLSDNLELKGIKCIETYPGGLAKELKLDMEKYKKNSVHINELTQGIKSGIPFELRNIPKNWHQFDSLLCWIICYKYLKGIAKSHGKQEEGIIYI